MSITFTDMYAGAGGSSTGLVNAGLELKLAANHWQVAVDTHCANHPDAEHLCAEMEYYDMRRLPRTDILWASPICTEISPAGGRPRTKGQVDDEEWKALPDKAFQRTRATAFEVIRAVTIHRYKAVLVENVIEFATDWDLFDWWLAGMVQLGYNYQIVCVSSAHIGDEFNIPAPQWRDRLYIVFTKVGIRLPNVKPTPMAFCEVCDEDVQAVQTWRKPRKPRKGQKPRRSGVGKYGVQYDYTCPCGHGIVEPYVQPASSVINWEDQGVRIADRHEHGLDPLAESTIARIEAGLEMFPVDPSLVTVNHSGHDGRAFRPDLAPLPSRCAKIGEGLLLPPGVSPYARSSPDLAAPPFVIELRNHGKARKIDRPLASVVAGGNHHGLVIPYRKGAKAKPTSEPLHTLSTHDSAGLLRQAARVEDCYFRMLKWREQMNAQRFPHDYIVTGPSEAARTVQAGNAVSCNVAQFFGVRVAAVL
ncbi:DNA cytosine methyltransferase [Streptomyces sp. ME02-6987-2C]|uniref:DNA cytosine methyltransferase n=1 Tax=unclassified Streptomyces TaxID=2593676 RepID=UPI00087D94C6|nr:MULTISPECIES: DNA cytosine methyltransferase [unclassified Streptomyces]MDX3365300.1 DNA cytosine methyltransferase [Streptomyces sp. ME02-6987-2C]MDX3422703.1 DNA cytosine methyltransferase [Streptomyces sp. ME02-6985-2c]REH20597.1 DNA (cytosine-5)-methyltransferase 1 [Streptomyces sp. 2221.1]SDT29688.1 DNA (cytosine-5)-methyltransferase 1 [Streptomyces sp. 2114.2]